LPPPGLVHGKNFATEKVKKDFSLALEMAFSSYHSSGAATEKSFPRLDWLIAR
jgi:hypothetical protein